jgi:hypothetical protein
MVLGSKDQGKTLELHKRLMAEKSLDAVAPSCASPRSWAST